MVEGKGVEMLLTLGTGMGCALFNEGVYVPNLELAHHPFRKGKTYEDYVGARALQTVGKKRWNRRVAGWWRRCCPSGTPATSTSAAGTPSTCASSCRRG